MSRALTVIGSFVSPYVRKVLACINLKGLAYEVDPITPFYGNEEFRRLSPLCRAGNDNDTAAAVQLNRAKLRNTDWLCDERRGRGEKSESEQRKRRADHETGLSLKCATSVALQMQRV